MEFTQCEIIISNLATAFSLIYCTDFEEHSRAHALIRIYLFWGNLLSLKTSSLRILISKLRQDKDTKKNERNIAQLAS